MPAHMNGMPRRFDAGKDAYAHEHRAHSGQDCRHIIANLTLLKYGADPRKYAAIAHQNYRMGGQHLNRSVENRLDTFGRGSRTCRGNTRRSPHHHRRQYDEMRSREGTAPVF